MACWNGPLEPCLGQTRCARAAGAGQAQEHYTEEYEFIDSDLNVLGGRDLWWVRPLASRR